MDATLLDSEAIIAPVPTVEVAAEDRYKTFPIASVSHFVVQLSDKRLDSIIQSITGVLYDFNKPWLFWFFIGKILSKCFFNKETQLE
ncbi:hypothetical protein N7488_000482 [Penicillium malachiteum]|nr:hypothetical protein N7488_000482 [Penicillium malachiteum]